MNFFCYINRIYEKSQLILTGVVVMSLVISGNKNIILLEETKDIKSYNDCSIDTREA
jgi:hypothetical protein